MNIFKQMYREIFNRCAVCGVQHELEDLQNVNNKYYICVDCLEKEARGRQNINEERRTKAAEKSGGLFT